MTDASYPRDLIGYGARRPDPQWPDHARVAVNFVLNYEEGSESSILDGDPGPETGLLEGATGVPAGMRDMNAESLYEYGSRVGFWRLMRLFEEVRVPLTVFACARALERNPEAARAIAAAGHDICCHGLRWEKHWLLSEAEERAHIREAVASLERTMGSRPLGWYCRTGPSVNTRRLLVEEGGFLYDSDAYNDELPYWDTRHGRPHLVIPYTMDVNDSKFANPAGFSSGADFYAYLKDSFDCLFREGAQQGSMLSIGLHMRLAGRPGRAEALRNFLYYVRSHSAVWLCQRIDIARHWAATHPCAA
ncbi:polysaccharide deacetylase family protein [Limobrevibacterium gyesilva]|uniref:Chitooligosaccharide deacetylase n=1 Tax=Limobrevibacterium gyesilva TaxID=2991712 RepID=A0AA42CFM1_9PROT|nr:polysaccharide deacetylase family protein [Limobrevibacterium gyesilva]MCW3475051.1 polysaccharide deacetylase family protein [Limobrevibacterium gyesilva]